MTSVYVGEIVCHSHEQKLEANAEEDAAETRNNRRHRGPDGPTEPEEGDDHAAGEFVSIQLGDYSEGVTYQGEAMQARGSRR